MSTLIRFRIVRVLISSFAASAIAFAIDTLGMPLLPSIVAGAFFGGVINHLIRPRTAPEPTRIHA